MNPLHLSAYARRGACRLPALVSSFVLCLVFLAGFTEAARAEAPGSIHGIATDPAGSRVPRAQVLLATPVGLVSTAEADAAGEFRFRGIPPGRYELRASSTGLVSEAVGVTVEAGQELRLTISLRLSALVESVVVSAAQVEVPLSRTPGSVSVISRNDMQARQLESIGDALRSVPGMAVSRSGGRGGVTSLFPRGGESDFTLVLVDGIKANAFGGGYDFSTLAATDVQRIEVVRGPESAVFGADAIGGVVQVVTRHGGAPRAEATVEGGSLGTLNLAAGTWGSRGPWSWGASGGRAASEGFTGTAPATGERVGNDDLAQTHASASSSWRWRSGTDVKATARFTRHQRGYPGPFGSNPIGAYTAVDRLSRGTTRNTQVGLRWNQPLGLARRVRLTGQAGYLDSENDFESEYGLSASASRRADARTQVAIDISPAAAASVGGEWQRERATSTFITGDTTDPLPIRRRVLAGFAELRLQPYARLAVSGGLRAEQIRRDALPRNLDPFAPRPAFGVHSDTAINPRVSATFTLPRESGRILSWTRLHATAGTGMRTPDALEIAFTDNPDLRPERSRSLEAGMDQALAGDRLVLAATFFTNHYDNLIVAVGPVLKDASRYRTDNISNARARGVETSAGLRTAWGLDVRATYTFLDTAILAVDRLGLAPPPFAAGDPLLRRPRHNGSLDLVFTRAAMTAFTRVGGRSRALDVEPSWGSYGGLFYNPGHVVLDAGISWRLSGSLEFHGRLGNVLDRRYEESLGFPALGRTAMIGVRLAAGR